MTLRPSKTLILAKTFDEFWKTNVFEPTLVLKAFWGSLGLLFGALGGFLGAFWLVLGAPWELQVAPENFENDSGALLGFFLLSSLSFFSLLHPLTASKWFFIFFSGLFFSSWSFSRLILSSQDGPLSVKNLDFSWSKRARSERKTAIEHDSRKAREQTKQTSPLNHLTNKIRTLLDSQF